MEFLTKEATVFLNKINIKRFGGRFVPPNNILNRDPLNYLVEMVGAEVFNKTLYPEYYHQAGLFLYNIISNHIFIDGNKRTGLDTCFLILDYNGYKLIDTVTDDLLISFVLSIAFALESLSSVQTWLKDNTERIT